MTTTTQRPTKGTPAFKAIAGPVLLGTLVLACCSDPVTPEMAGTLESAPQRTDPTDPTDPTLAPVPATEEERPASTDAAAQTTAAPSSTVEPEPESDQPVFSEQGGVMGPLAYWMSYGNEFLCCEEAIIQGTLQLDSNCLYVNDEGRVAATVWPYGTVWDAGTDAATLPDGTIATVGTNIRLAGGFHAADGLSKFTTAPVVYDYLESCDGATSTDVAVIQKS